MVSAAHDALGSSRERYERAEGEFSKLAVMSINGCICSKERKGHNVLCSRCSSSTQRTASARIKTNRFGVLQLTYYEDTPNIAGAAWVA